MRGERKVREALGPGWEIVATQNAVAGLREVKEAGEVDAIRAPRANSRTAP